MERTLARAGQLIAIRGIAGDREVAWVRRSDADPLLGGLESFPGALRKPEDADDLDPAVRGARASGVECDDTAALSVGSWRTPPYVPTRLDTHLYLVEARPLPGGDAGGSDDRALWVRPAAVLQRWRLGGALIPDPIRAVLESLAAERPVRSTLAALAESCRQALERSPQPDALEPIPGYRLLPLRTPTIPPATHTNCLVVGHRELILVDPATPFPEEQQRLLRYVDGLVDAGARPSRVVLTHHHVDHIGAVTLLRQRYGVPVVAHPRTAALVRTAGIEVQETLEDGAELILDRDTPQELRLQAILTPGHAPGHLVFFDASTRTLIAGDMMAGIGWIVVAPPEGDMLQYLQSLERMRELDPRALFPAHGGVVSDPHARIDLYVSHRMERERKVVRALQAATTDGEARLSDLLPFAYDDTPRMLWPLAIHSLKAHLFKLRDEGRAVEPRPGCWRPL